ncbi:MAG: hypothetical protein ACI3VX_00830 [Faecousia sp.]
MEETRPLNAQSTYPVWIEKEQGILSFHEVEGFEKYVFPCRSAMLEYVLSLAVSGFRVQ